MTGRHHRSEDELVELVLGAKRRLTREEVAAQAGVPLIEARRLWRAMGFADVGEATEFTDADVAALELILGLVRDGHLDVDGAVEIACAFGQTTARLADWQNGVFARVMAAKSPGHDPEHLTTAGDLDAVYAEVAAVMPALEALLIHAWRRQSAAVLDRAVSGIGPDEVVETTGLTVGFADLVGFTRLARRLHDDELASVVESFEATSADVVAGTGARLVKTLGDEVLFVAEDAEQAAETALRLHAANARDLDVPELRIGLATGQVVSRMGDVFGTTVNLAARLTALAHPGATLCDRTTADALLESRAVRSGRLAVRAVAPRPLRGLGLVRPYIVEGTTALDAGA